MKGLEGELIGSAIPVLAIDPGLSGAVCRLGGGKLELRRDFKNKQDIAFAIRDLATDVSHAVIEFVHAMPGQGVVSMFSFGRASGVADGALALCLPEHCAPINEVSPQRWQNFFRQKFGIEKGIDFDSRALASRIFPSYTQFFRRKLDHNSADSVLMAVWKILTL
jgi:crossover junction endodeoxyribonuclease RuvC